MTKGNFKYDYTPYMMDMLKAFENGDPVKQVTIMKGSSLSRTERIGLGGHRFDIDVHQEGDKQEMV